MAARSVPQTWYRSCHGALLGTDRNHTYIMTELRRDLVMKDSGFLVVLKQGLDVVMNRIANPVS
eukprot:38627-Eustigmatos_ZCMA.PRE.1